MYSGTKFYPVKTKLVPNPNEFEGPALIEKTVFGITRGYRNYLNEKRKEKQQEELMTLRAKLDYQKKTYSEVDQIDLQEFITKCKMYGGII